MLFELYKTSEVGKRVEKKFVEFVTLENLIEFIREHGGEWAPRTRECVIGLTSGVGSEKLYLEIYDAYRE